jgi:hypothetical protein
MSYYLTFFTLTDAQRRRSWRFFLGGGLLALIAGAALAATTTLWASPMGLRPSGWPWSPADGFGVGCGVLLALCPWDWPSSSGPRPITAWTAWSAGSKRESPGSTA